MDHTGPNETELIEEASRVLAAEWSPDARPKFVRAFSNHVYRLGGPEPRLFLRITSGRARSELELHSELQFVQYLATRGVPVGEPVCSRSGRLIHRVEIERQSFLACVFREAPGREFAELPRGQARDFFRLAGRTMRHLHRAGGDFVRPKDFLRFPWRDDRWVRFPELIPPTEREAWQLYLDLKAWTGDLPRDPAVFGLIHGDFTILNMRIEDDRITLFDFDSCCEHWYGYEIATFLHYFGGLDDDRRSQAYHEFLDGYAETGPIPEQTVASIGLFGKMRLLYSFLVFSEAWGFANLSREQKEYFALRRRLFGQPPTWPPA